MSRKLKKIEILILLATFSMGLGALAQQDGFLEDFVEIKADGHHFYMFKYAISAGEFYESLKSWNDISTQKLSDEAANLPALVNKEDAERYLEHISDTYLT